MKTKNSHHMGDTLCFWNVGFRHFLIPADFNIPRGLIPVTGHGVSWLAVSWVWCWDRKRHPHKLKQLYLLALNPLLYCHPWSVGAQSPHCMLLISNFWSWLKGKPSDFQLLGLGFEICSRPISAFLDFCQKIEIHLLQSMIQKLGWNQRNHNWNNVPIWNNIKFKMFKMHLKI